MNGKIKTISKQRGFGFIRKENGEDVFFHRSALLNGINFFNLREGDRVEFDFKESEKGPRAENIILAEQKEAQGPVTTNALDKLKRFFNTRPR